MKLEVGMYVWTKDGVIGKITQEDYTYYKSWIIDTLYYNFDEDVDKWTCGVKEYEISKASHTLLGNGEEPCLIEVGDYVNGYKVSFIGNDYKPFVQCDYPVEEGSTNHYRFYEEAIYSIVTKQQFLQMEYKVGE